MRGCMAKPFASSHCTPEQMTCLYSSPTLMTTGTPVGRKPPAWFTLYRSPAVNAALLVSRLLTAEALRKSTWYWRASPRLLHCAEETVVGKFVLKYVVPPSVTAPLTTFSPALSRTYQPPAALSCAAAVVGVTPLGHADASWIQSDVTSASALSISVALVPAGLSVGTVLTLPVIGAAPVPVSLNIYIRLLTVVSNGCSRSPLPTRTAS